MKELIVISGKGGAGKTSILSAFAALAENNLLCDADVDAADLHLITDPQINETHDFVSGHTATIDAERCTGCGVCRDLCRFAAISDDFVIDPLACEGCGVCTWFCPEKAIDFPSNTCGQWFISSTRFGPMVHASLAIAQENSGKLVTLVRSQGKRLAEKNNHALILTDGPPGLGCPVIASIGGASAVLIVTEPSVSGIHDMKRVAELAAFFKVPAMLCINKWDINADLSDEIEAFARRRQMPIVGKIPFDADFTRAMVQRQAIVEFAPKSVAAQSVTATWKQVQAQLNASA